MMIGRRSRGKMPRDKIGLRPRTPTTFIIILLHFSSSANNGVGVAYCFVCCTIDDREYLQDQ